MKIRFRRTDGLRKYARDGLRRRSSWYAKALAKADKEKAKRGGPTESDPNRPTCKPDQ